MWRIGTRPDAAGDGQLVIAGIVAAAGPDEHFPGFLPILRGMQAGT